MTPAASPRRGTLVAALWMSGAIASFSLLAVAARAVSPALDTFEIMLFRSGMGLLAVAVVFIASGRLHEARPRRLDIHAARNVIRGAAHRQ